MGRSLRVTKVGAQRARRDGGEWISWSARCIERFPTFQLWRCLWRLCKEMMRKVLRLRWNHPQDALKTAGTSHMDETWWNQKQTQTTQSIQGFSHIFTPCLNAPGASRVSRSRESSRSSLTDRPGVPRHGSVAKVKPWPPWHFVRPSFYVDSTKFKASWVPLNQQNMWPWSFVQLTKLSRCLAETYDAKRCSLLKKPLLPTVSWKQLAAGSGPRVCAAEC